MPIYLLSCVLGFSVIIDVTLIGRLSGADILCGIIVFYSAVTGKIGKSSDSEKQFYVFSLLWLVGLVLTDIYRDTPFEQYSRGWAKVLSFIVNFTAIRALFGKNIKSAIALVYVTLLAEAIKLSLGMGDDMIKGGIFGDPWKFGNGAYFTATILLGSIYLVRNPETKLFGLVLPFLAAAFNLSQNARNLFGISAISAFIFLISINFKRRLKPQTIAIFVAGGLVVGGGLISVYSYTASNGLLGVEAQQKYMNQTQGDLGILLGGRTETLASTQAILDSPIIGHGSWARDRRYVYLMFARMQQAGVRLQGDWAAADDLIPSHSHLLGAWVEAGLLGAVFWIWALWVTMKGLYAALRNPTPFTAFIVFVGLSLLWDIGFSPFGLDRKFVTAALLYLMMLCVPASKGAVNKRVIQ